MRSERGIAGRLSIVATPIGNLEDITLRALRTLKESDLVLAEDTRLTRRLCAHYDIKTPLRSFHAHTNERSVRLYLERLRKGERLALVTDAGTPVISDPGAVLIQRALAEAIAVESVPGPSAVTAALAVSGVACDSFRFVGFLPRSGTKREKLLSCIARATEATVIFESPQRISQTLADLVDKTEPGRRAALCREMTKLYEEVVNAPLEELARRFGPETKGEITLVVAGSNSENRKEIPADLDQTIRAYLIRGMTPRDTAIRLAQETDLPRKLIYQRILKVKLA
ncbi:MAG: 16S rRNA (cytidine(1402)-2'-O)-methyltransferase [Deltaproteobacteria bacterium]|nr:16S rRNA (cytidine(1402)-2'-O)-methyltransferase [Deltaproteobacteria bacterium]